MKNRINEQFLNIRVTRTLPRPVQWTIFISTTGILELSSINLTKSLKALPTFFNYRKCRFISRFIVYFLDLRKINYNIILWKIF